MTNEQLIAFCESTSRGILNLMERKNNDYTGGESPFANFEQSSDFGVDPIVGLSVRMGDKMKRIQTFCKNGKLSVTNEGVEDAYKDLIGYSLLALAMLNDRKVNDNAS